MNLPYMPGVRRVSPAGLPCDPGRVESGVRKRFRFIALLTLAVFMAGGTAASAATIANHMDYPVEGFSLWSFPDEAVKPLLAYQEKAVAKARTPNSTGSSGSSPGIWTWSRKPPSRCPKTLASFLKRTWATIS